MLDSRLVQKYNVPGPRYTSYPTAMQLKPIMSAKREPLAKLINSESKGLSLYIHLPFCNSLCWYCGCSKIITQNDRKADRYLVYLEKELMQAKSELPKKYQLKQVHFGGGTPTFLKPEQVKKLGEILHKHMNIKSSCEFGVEIDPRRFSKEMAEAWVSIGMNRASLGIQDTNAEVQQAINRIQPFALTEQTVTWLRDLGIKSINFDLIYGLPKQTEETFRQSILDTLSLSPDRFAIYSYAHLPHLFAGQRLINEAFLPQAEHKLAMLALAHEMLDEAGYVFIGMDHFAKPDDDLSKALAEGSLHRNFMGYSTHGGLDMVGLGLTSISKIGDHYFQNAKTMNKYEDIIGEGRLPHERSFSLSLDDRVRQQVIMDIMCKRRVDLNEVIEKFDIDADYFKQDIPGLNPLIEDGLVAFEDNILTVLEQGVYLLRNIAMVFDAYLKRPIETPQYSKTI